MMKYKNGLLSLMLVFVSVCAFAQITSQRYTEAEINTQKIFIEATKEKLLGNTDDAIFLFSDVIKKDKYNHAAYYELAKLYEAKNSLFKASNAANMAFQIQPENLWYGTLYADVLKKQNDFVEASNIYQKLVSLNRDDESLYFEWAYLLIKAQKTEEAIKVYDQLERQTSVSERTARRKHMLYSSLGKNTKAEDELKKLIKAFPVETQYYHLLADFYNRTGKEAEAKKIYQKILELNPEDATAEISLAKKSIKKNNDLAMLTSLETMFRDPEISLSDKLKELAPYQEKVNDIKDQTALNQLFKLGDILTTTHESEALAYKVSADLLYATGRSGDALTKYKTITKMNPNNFEVWEQIMYIHLEKNQKDELLDVSEEVLDYFPNQGVAYYMNGIANSSLKNFRDAKDMLEQALMLAQSDKTLMFKIYTELGSIYNELKTYKESDKNYEAALALSPKDYYLLNQYSYSLAIRGENLDKAKAMATTANELAPNRPIFEDTKGLVFYKMGDYENAKKWLKRALEHGGDNTPKILEHYGDALFQLNNTEQAVQYWQQARDKGGKSNLLDKKIADRKLYE